MHSVTTTMLNTMTVNRGHDMNNKMTITSGRVVEFNDAEGNLQQGRVVGIQFRQESADATYIIENLSGFGASWGSMIRMAISTMAVK